MRVSPVRHIAPGLAAALLILSTSAAGHAQDGRSFFEQLFGAPPSQPAPQQSTLRPDAYGFEGHGYHRSARRPRLRTRYAALPKAEDDAKLAGKQPVDQKAIADNPTKAILADKTLQPGDIVVLPGGPRVFTGGSDKRHRLSDFEDVKHSGLVDKRTRQQLLAMMVPVGAMPADQARKVIALKRKLARPEEIAEVETQKTAERNAAGARVINPWTAVR